MWMVKVTRICHQVPWTQKAWQKDKDRVNILISKYFNKNNSGKSM